MGNPPHTVQPAASRWEKPALFAKSPQRLHSLRPPKVSKCPGHTNCILATIPVAYGKSADISAHYCSTAVSPALSHPKQNLLWIIPLLLCRPAQCFLENGLGAGGILWASYSLDAIRTCPPFSPRRFKISKSHIKVTVLKLSPWQIVSTSELRIAKFSNRCSLPEWSKWMCCVATACTGLWFAMKPSLSREAGKSHSPRPVPMIMTTFEPCTTQMFAWFAWSSVEAIEYCAICVN